MKAHFATLWEAIADEIGDREALVCGEERRTWSTWEQRSSKLARAFRESGLGPGSKVGLYLFNCNEYLESQFAAFKVRGVPVNINYRYLDDELLYLLENSDAEALVFHSSLSARVSRIMDRARQVRLWVEVDDGGAGLPGSAAYEALVRGHPPAARCERSEDDVYMFYTGGTTGMPKGVMYEMGNMVRSFVAMGFSRLGVATPEIEAIPETARRLWMDKREVTSIPACPLMHGTGAWLGAMIPHSAGARVVTLPNRSFDAAEIWRVAEKERATQLVIVGDAFARPMVDHLDAMRAQGVRHNLSRLSVIISSGVMWSAEVKQALLEHGDFTLLDNMGSSEGGMGSQTTTRESDAMTGRFQMNPTTKVFSEDGREVTPGSGEAGMIASGGAIPIGYFKDPEKSAGTFRTIDGVRYAFAGDWARVESDGSLTLLGRGSNCINTAGEKVYPEEVEEALKAHPEVRDCLVVGTNDERFGERVVAILATEGVALSNDDLLAFGRKRLASYKLPRDFVRVDAVRRAPNGKPDYEWAREEIQRKTSS